MKKSFKSNIFLSVAYFLLFIVFTVSVKLVDVALVGNKLSPVGFSTLNEVFFNLFSNLVYDGPYVGDSMPKAIAFSKNCYNISEYLGYFAILVAVFFVCVGAFQLFSYKSFKKINKNIYALGAFYVVVMAFYVFFEVIVINYRPVMSADSIGLEASYPSSHTILTLCILASALIVIKYIFKNIKSSVFAVISIISTLVMVATIATRLMSGVHWFTDIIGGILLSMALVMSFKTAVLKINE